MPSHIKSKKALLPLLFFFMMILIALIKTKQATISPLIIPLNTSTQLIFITSGSTTKQILKDFDCDSVANGSYFGSDEKGNFFPAGEWIVTSWDVLYQTNLNPDPNLQETLALRQKSDKVSFFLSSWSKVEPGSVIFNTGPRILKSEVANPALWENISHRNWQFPRTILAQKNGETSLIIFKNPITLSDTRTILKKLWYENAVNLDGWPSTALSSKNAKFESFNENTKLPIFFCIK